MSEPRQCPHCGGTGSVTDEEAPGALNGETPGQKSARLRMAQRIRRDDELSYPLATLIRQGHTTDSARLLLGIGALRAARIRAIAVRKGLLAPHKKAQHYVSGGK